MKIPRPGKLWLGRGLLVTRCCGFFFARVGTFVLVAAFTAAEIDRRYAESQSNPGILTGRCSTFKSGEMANRLERHPRVIPLY